MTKSIIILLVLLGALCYTLIVVTATPADKDQYEAYERYKERKKKEDHTDCQWK